MFNQAGVEKSVYIKSPKVSVDRDGKTHSTMGPSIILAAGALGSPKILQNSGIGPRKMLEKAGICPVVDSPQVGRNIYDHPTVGVAFSISPTLSAEYPNAYDLMDEWSKYTASVELDLQNSDVCPSTDFFSTILSSPGLSSGGFLTSPYAVKRSKDIGLNGETQPDIQLTVYPTVSEPHMMLIEKQRNESKKMYRSKRNMLVTVSLLDPLGTLDIGLNLTFPKRGAPVFSLPDGRDTYLHELDLKRLQWGIEQVREIFQYEPMASYVQTEISPGINEVNNNLLTWVKENAFANSHWVGSIRMGRTLDAANPYSWKKDIKESAVDEKLRLRGVTGVYVVGKT